MRLLVLLALVAAVTAGERRRNPFMFGGLMDAARGLLAARANAQEVKINALWIELENLEAKMNKIRGVPDMDKLEGTLQFLEQNRKFNKQKNMDCWGNDLNRGDIERTFTSKKCADKCVQFGKKCIAFAYVVDRKECWIKDKCEESNTVYTTGVDLYIRQKGGYGCAKKEFQCGGTQPQCISALAVCDGIEDCKNGNDEKEVCDRVPKSGSSWLGVVQWKRCTFDHAETPIRLIVTGGSKPKYSGGIYEVTVTSILEGVVDGQTAWKSINHKGQWYYGLRKLILQPAGPRRIGMLCTFIDVAERAYCRVMTEGGQQCGAAEFFKQ